MTDIPAPLTPPDCDLRGMEWMPLHGHKLEGSDFDSLANDTEYRAAHRLWWAAWQQQVPAASLPDNDRILCNLAGFQRDPKGWEKVREMALHGFVKCNDGRLYHRFLSIAAITAYEMRLKSSSKREADRKRLQEWRDRQTKKPDRDDDGNGTGNGGGNYNGNNGGNGSEAAPETPRETIDETEVETRFVGRRQHKTVTGQDIKKERVEVAANAPPAPAPDPEPPREPTKRATRLPPDWQPSQDDRAFALNLGLNVQSVAAGFRDYWHAKAGKDATKLDWSATWRNWCRKEKPPTVQPTFRNGFAELLAERPTAVPDFNDDLPDFLRISHVPN
jgi:hypothetical protein